MDKINFQDLPSTTTPLNATNLNQLQTNVENALVKTEDFNVSITPSTSRGSSGYGDTSVSITSIGATKILGVTFSNSSNYMLWGVSNDISSNPSSLSVYGYRIAGTYSSAVTCKMRVMYI